MTRDAARVSGVVVAFDLRPSDGHFVYAPVVQYDSAQGLRRVTGDVASFPAAYEIGEGADVLVVGTDPATIIIDSIHERHFFALLAAGLGALASIIASVELIRTRR